MTPEEQKEEVIWFYERKVNEARDRLMKAVGSLGAVEARIEFNYEMARKGDDLWTTAVEHYGHLYANELAVEEKEVREAKRELEEARESLERSKNLSF